MSPSQTALWQRLQAFEIDNENTRFSFCQRLARENAWSLSYAQAVVEEYKRFLFLCVATEHPHTPSDEVDQAWHLHLSYTRSYWDELCAKVLQCPLHHNPTKGGRQEGDKFQHWYQRTLATYHEYFGTPPTDIWPSAERRFSRPQHMRRLDTQANWVIPKPQWHQQSPWLRISLLAFLSLGLASCSVYMIKDGIETVLPYIFGATLVLFLLIFVITLIFGNKNQRRRKGRTNSRGSHSTGTTSSFEIEHDNDGDAGDSGCGGSGCSGCGGGGD